VAAARTRNATVNGSLFRHVEPSSRLSAPRTVFRTFPNAGSVALGDLAAAAVTDLRQLPLALPA
jgi:hypothetical protein